MLARHGRPPRAGTAYPRRPGAYAILIRDGRILLTVQDACNGPEVQLPGGGIDSGEHLRPALLREIREETGYTAVIARRLGAYREFTWMPDYGMHREKVCQVYLGFPGLRLGPPGERGHRALWLDLREAPSRVVSEGARRFLVAFIFAVRR